MPAPPPALPGPALPGLLGEVGLPPSLAESVVLTGEDRPFDSPFPVVECAASVLGAIGAAASFLWEQRTGAAQPVTVSRGHAGASLVGFAFQRLEDGETPVPPFGRERPLVKLYRCGDGRFVHLQGQFPHLAQRACDVLGCAVDSPAEVVAQRVAAWDGLALEEALAAADACGALARSADEWAAHPQAAAIAPLGRVSIEKIGDSPPETPWRQNSSPSRPLDGLRVLDLSRLLAGPTNGRTLAEHGAQVLLVNSARLANVPAFVMDTGHGKRSCRLELDEPDGLTTLRELVAGADVFTQGYRGGSLERRGLGPEDLAGIRPGIVVVTINCYGDAGPWRSRPGWEQMAQTVSGMAVGQGGSDHPALVPAAACDYTTGYLAALGTLAALQRRAEEGGSYHVRASLCQTAGWFTRAALPATPAAPPATPAALPPPPSFGDVESYMTSTPTPYGRLRHLSPVVKMPLTPPRWDVPTSPIGSHPPSWEPAPPPALTV
jgi:crotonobetainyl-CoA:carnitine CoA-transferase CaiB-like acyl-CoA transferase